MRKKSILVFPPQSGGFFYRTPHQQQGGEKLVPTHPSIGCHTKDPPIRLQGWWKEEIFWRCRQRKKDFHCLIFFFWNTRSTHTLLLKRKDVFNSPLLLKEKDGAGRTLCPQGPNTARPHSIDPLIHLKVHRVLKLLKLTHILDVPCCNSYDSYNKKLQSNGQI